MMIEEKWYCVICLQEIVKRRGERRMKPKIVFHSPQGRTIEVQLTDFEWESLMKQCADNPEEFIKNFCGTW